MNKENKHVFKVGDMVYCPRVGNGVYKVRSTPCSDGHSLVVGHLTTTVDGFFTPATSVPVIIAATPDNRDLLVSMYGVNFDAPPEPQTGSDLVRQALKSGKPVVCQVDGVSQAQSDHDDEYIVVIIEYHSATDRFIDATDVEWEYASLVDPDKIYRGDA